MAIDAALRAVRGWIDEDELQLWTKRRGRDDATTRVTAATKRWQSGAERLRLPAAPRGTRVSVDLGDGTRARSFHFGLSSVSKEARLQPAGADGARPARTGAPAGSNGRAEAHAAYVECDGAAEMASVARDAREGIVREPASAGSSTRYDPRSNAARGIDTPVSRHLGTAASALEAAGVPTVAGSQNALAHWTHAEQKIATTLASRLADRERACSELAATVLERGRSLPVDGPEQHVARLQEIIRAHEEASRWPALQAELDRFAMLERKARLRAEQVAKNCRAMLTAMAGKAGAAAARERAAIEHRAGQAATHLDQISHDLAPHRHAIDKLGVEI